MRRLLARDSAQNGADGGATPPTGGVAAGLTPMSNTEPRGKSPTDAVDEQYTDADVRRRITDRAELSDTVDVATVVADVARDLNMAEARVRKEFDKLEQHGFVYTVGDDDTAEVRLP